MSIFDRFFKDEEGVDDLLVSKCHEVVAFGNVPYFQDFMAYLEREIDKPIAIGDQVQTIRSVERINTFKEIRAHLRRQLREAQDILDREARA